MPGEQDVLITGLGPVTSIGVGGEALWSSLIQGRSNVCVRHLPFDLGRMAELPIAAMDSAAVHAVSASPAANPVDAAIPGLDGHLRFLDTQDAAGHRDLAYALLAVELAIKDAKLEYDRERNEIGVVQVFEAPGVESTVSRLFQMMATPPPGNGPPQVYDALAPFFYNMQPFVYVHLMGKAFGFHGFSTSVHNACTSGAFAIEIAAQRIRSGRNEVMIVAGGEAFDTAVRLEWFRRLELYAREPVMRPFDAESSGFYVGEGGAAIVLESRKHAESRGAKAYGEYLGGGFAQQSWKQVIPDVRQARLHEVIKQALATTGVHAGDLDLIVPHGAATQLSDGYEANCLTQSLRGAREHAVATAFKPIFGHLLAANALLETIAIVLALKHQTVPPTLHTNPERVKLPISLVTATLSRPMRMAMKLSTGFTGHDAAMLFRSEPID